MEFDSVRSQVCRHSPFHDVMTFAFGTNLGDSLHSFD